jgi:hypothetical protein
MGAIVGPVIGSSLAALCYIMLTNNSLLGKPIHENQIIAQQQCYFGLTSYYQNSTNIDSVAVDKKK